jgi:hypothetical protein
MANPTAPTEGGGRRVPYSKDPANAGTAYQTAVRGAVAMSGETPVGHATVIAPATTATRSSVASSASDVLLLAANAKRVGATFYNQSTQILYLALGTVAASATSYTKQIAADGYFEIPVNYAGEIRGIWASANGNARITELAHA